MHVWIDIGQVNIYVIVYVDYSIDFIGCQPKNRHQYLCNITVDTVK